MNKLPTLFIALTLLLASACKKDAINTDYLQNQSWYISNPASLVNGAPVVFGADSVYYSDGQPIGTWRKTGNAHIFLRANFGGADSIEFDIVDLRADFLKFKITKSNLNAQENQIVEADTIP